MELQKLLFKGEHSFLKLVHYIDIPTNCKIVWWSLEAAEETTIELDLYKNDNDNLLTINEKPILLNSKYNEGFIDLDVEFNELDAIKINFLQSLDNLESILFTIKIKEI